MNLHYILKRFVLFYFLYKIRLKEPGLTEALSVRAQGVEGPSSIIKFDLLRSGFYNNLKCRRHIQLSI